MNPVPPNLYRKMLTSIAALTIAVSGFLAFTGSNANHHKPTGTAAVVAAPVTPHKKAVQTPPAPATKPAPAKPAPPPPSPPAPVTYVVQPGDSLSAIAAKTLGSSSRYPEIVKLNKAITNPDRLTIGWKLVLPSGAAPTPAASPPTTPAPPASTPPSTPAPVTYANNLSGWINQAISILGANGIHVSYNAIYQTAIHESSGNPSAINGSDANAAAGHPSMGLMQTIAPTFNAYALPGHGNVWNPVDNIIAAVRYATAIYGSLDSVVAVRCGGACWSGY